MDSYLIFDGIGSIEREDLDTIVKPFIKGESQFILVSKDEDCIGHVDDTISQYTDPVELEIYLYQKYGIKFFVNPFSQLDNKTKDFCTGLVLIGDKNKPHYMYEYIIQFFSLYTRTHNIDIKVINIKI